MKQPLKSSPLILTLSTQIKELEAENKRLREEKDLKGNRNNHSESNHVIFAKNQRTSQINPSKKVLTIKDVINAIPKYVQTYHEPQNEIELAEQIVGYLEPFKSKFDKDSTRFKITRLCLELGLPCMKNKFLLFKEIEKGRAEAFTDRILYFWKIVKSNGTPKPLKIKE